MYLGWLSQRVRKQNIDRKPEKRRKKRSQEQHSCCQGIASPYEKSVRKPYISENILYYYYYYYFICGWGWLDVSISSMSTFIMRLRTGSTCVCLFWLLKTMNWTVLRRLWYKDEKEKTTHRSHIPILYECHMLGMRRGDCVAVQKKEYIFRVKHT